jgi:hypothetical protein
MTAISSTVASKERPESKARLASGWWLLPCIIGGAAIWVWLGVALIRWLF